MEAMLGHESWFTNVRPPFDWGFGAQPMTLLAIVVARWAAVAWRVIGGRLRRPELPFLEPLGRLSPWVPRLLAIHAGVSLLALAARHDYYVPSLHLASTPFGAAVAIIEGALGVWLVTGVRIRPAALAVVI